jgi:hypothetical protein
LLADRYEIYRAGTAHHESLGRKPVRVPPALAWGKALVAQVSSPVLTQAKACGYIFSLKFSPDLAK